MSLECTKNQVFDGEGKNSPKSISPRKFKIPLDLTLPLLQMRQAEFCLCYQHTWNTFQQQSIHICSKVQLNVFVSPMVLLPLATEKYFCLN